MCVCVYLCVFMFVCVSLCLYQCVRAWVCASPYVSVCVREQDHIYCIDEDLAQAHGSPGQMHLHKGASQIDHRK